MSNGQRERKSFTLGDLKLKENYNQDTKTFEQSFYDIKDEHGNVIESLEEYELKIYIADDIDEAGIGEPSVVLKKDQFINARALSQAERERLPDFLYENGDRENGRCKAVAKVRLQTNRKQYPKKEK